MRNRLSNELAVCGFNAVAAIAEYHPDRIRRLFLREEHIKPLASLCKSLAEQKKPYKVCEDEELERLCKSPRHQGIVAMIDEPEVPPLSMEDVESWAAEGKTGLILDSVGNDNNLGAIARAAAFFGVSYVVLSEADKEARLTSSAYRVAEGGMEHLTFRSVRDSAAFIKDASKQLLSIGADHRARLRLKDLGNLILEKTEKLKQRRGANSGVGLVLVVGNEERGLNPATKEQCSLLIRIPGTGLIESLNVAQATALFLHELFEI